MTAGNAAQQKDAEDRPDALKLTPMAWLVGWAAAGLEAMCIGGGQAMAAVFERAA